MEKLGLTVEEAEKVLMVAGFKFGPYDFNTMTWAVQVPEGQTALLNADQDPFLWAWQYVFGPDADYKDDTRRS